MGPLMVHLVVDSVVVVSIPYQYYRRLVVGNVVWWFLLGILQGRVRMRMLRMRMRMLLRIP